MSSDNFVPFECPVCLTLMRDVKDVFSYFSSKCCSECKEDYLMANQINDIEEFKISKRTRNSLKKKRREIPSYILR